MSIVEWMNRNLLGSEGSPLSPGIQNTWHFHNMTFHILYSYWLSFILHFKWRIPHFKSSQLSKLLSLFVPWYGDTASSAKPQILYRRKKKNYQFYITEWLNMQPLPVFHEIRNSTKHSLWTKNHHKNHISENKWEKQDLQQLSQSEGFALWWQFCLLKWSWITPYSFKGRRGTGSEKKMVIMSRWRNTPEKDFEQFHCVNNPLLTI